MGDAALAGLCEVDITLVSYRFNVGMGDAALAGLGLYPETFGLQ